MHLLQAHLMDYVNARVSTGNQSVMEQMVQLRAAGCSHLYPEIWSGVKSDRRALRCVLDQLATGDQFMVARFDRPAVRAMTGSINWRLRTSARRYNEGCSTISGLLT